jgi:uncharacterized RDD family membrane protein YckC
MSIDDDIILGEGVAIDAGAAPVTLRIASGLIDVIAIGAVLWGAVLVASPILEVVNGALQGAIVVSLIVVSLVVIPATSETLTRGLSPGRLAVGLRIVRDDGGPITARHAFGRALVGVLEIFMTAGLVAITTSMLSDRGKRVGDILVGTYSMRTRGGRKALPPVAMPYSLHDWARTADIARLPDGLALTARLFLSRAGSMEVNARARLGGRIADDMLAHVSPAPPVGTHPENLIAAVVATRRDREYSVAIRMEAANQREAQRLARLPFGVPDVEN